MLRNFIHHTSEQQMNTRKLLKSLMSASALHVLTLGLKQNKLAKTVLEEKKKSTECN